MRHERHRRAELLLDLRGVPVGEHAVCGHAAMVLAEMRPLARRLAGAGNAGLGVHHDRASSRPARPAARARAARPSDSSPGTRPASPGGWLRHAAPAARRPRPRERGGGRIPALPVGVAADAEGAREVDHTDAALSSAAPFPPTPPRAAPERRCRRRGEPIDVERRDRAIPDALQRRQRPRRARRARRHRLRQRHRRMPGQQADQLLAGVAGGAGDRDAGARGRRRAGAMVWRRAGLLWASSPRREKNIYTFRCINSQDFGVCWWSVPRFMRRIAATASELPATT